MTATLSRKNSIVRRARRAVFLVTMGLLTVSAVAFAASRPSSATTERSTTTTAPESALADLGCDRGAIHTFVRVKGDLGGFPNIYTTSTTFLDTSYNCTGGTISARRVSTGVYLVRFAGDQSKLAIAQNNADDFGTESALNDNILTVARVTDTDGGISFRVEVQDVCDCSSGSDPQDGRFVLMVI